MIVEFKDGTHYDVPYGHLLTGAIRNGSRPVDLTLSLSDIRDLFDDDVTQRRKTEEYLLHLMNQCKYFK